MGIFKDKEFKKLVGFDHHKLVIASILVTGISFPFIFLGNEINAVSNKGIMHALIGWFHAGILHFANLFIFYKFKKYDEKRNSVSTIKLFFRRNYPVHFITTVIVTGVMSIGPYQSVGIPCTEALLIKSIIGTIILMSVIVGFYETAFYMNALNLSVKEREKLKRQNVESQLEILKSQVQPHFLFNSLNTLASIIPEEPEVAVQYVQNLSKVYRYILEIKDKKLIPVYEEMKCVHAYLFMLETRFGENLHCNVDLENIEDNHFIVPLSIQMLVENAVKHNVISTKRPLMISITSESGMLKVCNNLQLKDQQVISTGTGLENISNRYEITAQKKVLIHEDDETFSVQIPLIEVSLS